VKLAAESPAQRTEQELELEVVSGAVVGYPYEPIIQLSDNAQGDNFLLNPVKALVKGEGILGTNSLG